MKNLIYILSFCAFTFLVACADLDEPQPINSIPTSSAISDAASAGAALNGVFSDMQDGTLAFDGWLSLAQYFSDETDFTGTFPTRLEFGNFNVFPANATSGAVFTDFYEVINRANNVIALVPTLDDPTFTDAQRSDVIAQARFVRGFVYSHLASLYQEVPVITDPTVEVNEILNVPKSSTGEVFAQAIDDLTFAQSNISRGTGPLLPSTQAATALLARIALYQERWSDALSLANQALGGANVSDFEYLQDQIYSLGFTPTDGNSIAFFYGPAELGGRHSIEPSQTLIDAYEPGDSLRMRASVDLTTASVPFGIKYPSFEAANSGTSTDPIFFVRHAEMAFIIAEANAEMGNFGPASDFLNQVRSRAGLADVTLDASNFEDLILQERFVELAMEGAHRLIDLRRRGQAISVLGPLGYDSCDDMWPLPQRDVDRNPSLVQNSCCNC